LAIRPNIYGKTIKKEKLRIIKMNNGKNASRIELNGRQ
jgi:hypothetical protein